MTDIAFYNEFKKIPDYNSILNKISLKNKDFKYNEFIVKDKEELLTELYKLRGKQRNTNSSIFLDIFISKDILDKKYLNRSVNLLDWISDYEKIWLNWRLNFLSDDKRDILINIVKIYRINKMIQHEISSYIYNKPWMFSSLKITYYNNEIKDTLSLINEDQNIHIFVRGNVEEIKNIIDKYWKENVNKSFEKAKNLFNNKPFFIDDINIGVDLDLNSLLKFVIRKIEESNIQVDTTKIEDLFQKLSDKSIELAQDNKKNLLWILVIIIVINLSLILYNYHFSFDLSRIPQYIPMLLLEIILLKFMFFFFDKYNTYSKISSLYDYYTWLVQADNIYTTDKKFTSDQNFILREKTYLELTNLSSHLKWLVDKKWESNSKEILDILKEINNISPLFKNLNK